MADSDGRSGTPYRTFRSMVERADRKFALVRDLPAPQSNAQHLQQGLSHCFRKAFKAYTRVWRFQQERRAELVATGLRRWEIGEVASRIGQLYYAQYLRTSESRFLLEAYVFYEAIFSRGYFDEGRKGKAKAKAKGKGTGPDLGVRAKELRFYARFVVVALLMDRAEVVRQLVERFRGILDDCRLSFPETDFKEWRIVLQEITRLLKAENRGFPTTRPLRYNVLFDSHSTSLVHLARFHPSRVLKLQDAILTSYHRNEVKFAELTLDTYRILQCLEWEPSGSFYQKVKEPISNGGGAYSDVSGASGLIDINLSTDLTDPNLPPNPRKAILYRPCVAKIIAAIATICEGLSPDNVLLLYLSASGRSDQNITFQKENSGLSRNSNANSSTQPARQSDSTSYRHHGINGEDSNELSEGFLCFGSRGNNVANNLYPADLIPFTRRPLFLIIDSDNSNAFKAIHGAERGEIAAMLLSPTKIIPQYQSTDTAAHGSQFTFFLTAPLQAFCQLVGLSSEVDATIYNNADSILFTALSKWEVMLCSPHCLDKVWSQVFPDPFLRRLILRFIFCRSVLHLIIHPGKCSQYIPSCLPELPDCVSPDSPSVQSSIHLLAEILGVASQFNFTTNILNSAKADPS